MALTGITSGTNVTSVLSDVDLTAHSLEVLYQAQPKLVFEQFAEIQEDLQKQPGQTVRFLKMLDTVEGDSLEESVRIAVDDISSTHVDITVVEWGKGFAVTELLLRTSAYELMTSMDKLMADNYAKTSNLMYIQTIYQNAANFMYGHDRAGRSSLNGADVMTTDILKNVTEDLSTRNVPGRASESRGMSDAYVAVIHPHVARQIKNDPEFIKAKHYGAPEDLFYGELGVYDNIRFIQSTFVPVIKHPGTYTPFGGGAPVTPPATTGHVFINNINMTDRKPTMFPAQTIVAGSPPIYQTSFYGDRAIALAEVLPVELRHNGIIDFEREREIAWYAIRGVGLVNDDRILIVETR